MKHVLILIAAHCQPEVLKYTLGTWLETYDGSYDASVCVSLSDTFEDICERTHEFLEMAPPLDIIRVSPSPKPNDRMLDWYWSSVHANCLQHLMLHCRDIPFTHMAILDHDLEFKSDFIRWSIDQDADMVCSLFRDRQSLLTLGNYVWAPKVSVWNTVISRKLFDKILETPDIVMPSIEGLRLVYDTFAKVFEFATEIWKMDVRVFPESKIDSLVKHLWSLSFSFGQAQEGYEERFRKLGQDYSMYFPNGIRYLLSKLE